MKRLIVIILIVSYPLLGCPKNPVIGEYSERVVKVKIPGASEDIKSLMLEAAQAIDACLADPGSCDGLPDPWKNGKMQTLPEQIETVRNDPNSGVVQLAMARFERAMLDELGGSVLTKSNVFTTFAYHAGYGTKNIEKRMNKYLELLEKTD